VHTTYTEFPEHLVMYKGKRQVKNSRKTLVLSLDWFYHKRGRMNMLTLGKF